jgi:putative transposase
MLRVVTGDNAGAEMRGALDEIVLHGARRMLTAALEAEADEYIARLAGELDERGRRLVVRKWLRRSSHDHHCGRPDRGDRSQD